jgi:hypothetical protein
VVEIDRLLNIDKMRGEPRRVRDPGKHPLVARDD